MMFSFLISAFVLMVFIYFVLRGLGEIGKGIFFFLLAFVIYLFFFHSQSDLTNLKISGSFIRTLTNYLRIPNYLKSKIFRVDILSVEKSTNKHLLISIENKGMLPLSNYTVFVDGKKENILNNPKDPLYPREVTVIEIRAVDSFKEIEVRTNHAIAIFRS